jgi:hypothetical protein
MTHEDDETIIERLTARGWEAMVADFKATLNTFNVPQREQQELITIVGSTKNDIVRS